MDNIVLVILTVFLGLFGLMLSFYLSLCFIQWIGDILEGLKRK